MTSDLNLIAEEESISDLVTIPSEVFVVVENVVVV
jgi:hypothetical protein